MELREQAKALRERAGLSRAQLGARMGVDSLAVHRWENGRKRIDDQLWAQIQEAVKPQAPGVAELVRDLQRDIAARIFAFGNDLETIMGAERAAPITPSEAATVLASMPSSARRRKRA